MHSFQAGDRVRCVSSILPNSVGLTGTVVDSLPNGFLVVDTDTPRGKGALFSPRRVELMKPNEPSPNAEGDACWDGNDLLIYFAGPPDATKAVDAVVDLYFDNVARMYQGTLPWSLTAHELRLGFSDVQLV